MDGVPKWIVHPLPRIAAFAPLLVALAACAGLQEIARQSGADPVTWELPARSATACRAPPATASQHHPHGDTAWVGRLHDELVRAHGPPFFQLGKPHRVSDGNVYVVAVYADPQSANACVHAYVRNPCGRITAYHCR